MNSKIINFLLVIILYILLKQYFTSNGVPKFLWGIWYNYLAKFNLQTMNYGYTYLEDKYGINNLVNKNKYFKALSFELTEATVKLVKKFNSL